MSRSSETVEISDLCSMLAEWIEDKKNHPKLKEITETALRDFDGDYTPYRTASFAAARIGCSNLAGSLLPDDEARQLRGDDTWVAVDNAAETPPASHHFEEREHTDGNDTVFAQPSSPKRSSPVVMQDLHDPFENMLNILNRDRWMETGITAVGKLPSINGKIIQLLVMHFIDVIKLELRVTESQRTTQFDKTRLVKLLADNQALLLRAKNNPKSIFEGIQSSRATLRNN